MRAAFSALVLALAFTPRGALASEDPPEDDAPEPKEFITPGRVNVSGEDPMFPDRTTSRDPPPARKKRARVAPSAETLARLARGPSRIELEAQLFALNRSLSFVHLIGSDLRGHEVSLAPAIGLSARAFPIPTSVPFLSGFGLHLEYWQSLGLESSRVDGGPALETSLAAMELGLRYRYDGRAILPGLELTPLVAFHRASFTIAASGADREPDVPNLAYAGAKLGLEGRVGVHGPVRIEAELAFLPIFSTGGELESERFFAGASGYGVSARARFGMHFAERWLLLLGAELINYSFDLEPGPRSAVQLSDRVLGVSLGLRVVDPLRDD